MRIVTIVDTETTGIETEGNFVVEIAVALYDLKYACIIDQASYLILSHGLDAEKHAETEEIHKIPWEVLKEYGNPPEEVCQKTEDYFSCTDAILAHNAAFDKRWVATLPYSNMDVHAPWICTKSNVVWPTRVSSNKLIVLAVESGVPVVQAHRALADVQTICSLLTKMKEQGVDLEELLSAALVDSFQPRFKVIAEVTYEHRLVAKEEGFFWNDMERLWKKNMKESAYNELKAKYENDSRISFVVEGEDPTNPLVEVIATVSYGNRGLARDEGFSWDADKRCWRHTMREDGYVLLEKKYKIDNRISFTMNKVEETKTEEPKAASVDTMPAQAAPAQEGVRGKLSNLYRSRKLT
jgi:DNA polymerase III epsilon subunit-like protein